MLLLWARLKPEFECGKEAVSKGRRRGEGLENKGVEIHDQQGLFLLYKWSGTSVLWDKSHVLSDPQFFAFREKRGKGRQTE